MVLLLLVGPQSVPPLPQDLADGSVVLVGMSLVHQGPVAFTEDHECIHGTADVVFLPLFGVWKKIERYLWQAVGVTFNKLYNISVSFFLFYGLHGGLTFLSPSLGKALRDCVRLFMGPVEGAGSLATPGENLHSHTDKK